MNELGHDPHRYEEPTAMHMPSDATSTINRRGYAADGSILWIHGPEPLGPRGGRRWAVRGKTLAFNRNHHPRSHCWDRGCAIFRSEAEALAYFRELTGGAS